MVWKKNWTWKDRPTTEQVQQEFDRITDILVRNNELEVLTDIVPDNIKREFVENFYEGAEDDD